MMTVTLSGTGHQNCLPFKLESCTSHLDVTFARNYSHSKGNRFSMWPVWLNGRAFARDPKGRGYESRPVRFQVTA